MDNYTDKKRCPICREYKELTGANWYFQANGRAMSYCKPCQNKKRREERAYYKTMAKETPEYKTCPSCKESKHNTEWPRNKTTKDGLHYYCKKCASIRWANRLETKVRNENEKQKRVAKSSRFTQYSYGFVYLIKLNEYIKIGISVDPQKRLSSLDGATPYSMEIIHTIETDNMQRLEQELHSRFVAKHHKKEWFLLSDKDIEDVVGMGEKIIYGG